ncbi:MAG: carboxymuconolactone decarboxylase family protein [Candidatus Freyarchaeota archaeon]|nr:carboxymuconolactone decarboxylase family protein [Candidatus Jordarchaeia archaeon]
MSPKGEEALKAFQKFSEEFPEDFKRFTAFAAKPYAFFDPKTRELIITTILATKGYESEFKFHLNELVRNGFTVEELRNLLLLILTYLGAPKFLQVFRWCKEEGKL